MRPRARAACFLALTAGALIALFATGAASGRLLSQVSVRPRAGSPTTQVKISFVARFRTGRSGPRIRRIVLHVRGPSGSAECVSNVSRRLAVWHAGMTVHATLNPANLGGTWCLGSFHGRLIELVRPVCPDSRVCATSSPRRHVLARFAFTVTETTASGSGPNGPTFAGLERTTFCAGGTMPQTTRVYHLSWQPATEPSTPSSQIAYEIFMASSPGAEDFSQPTWTTAATTFDTPPQPANGDRYFVVRARDQAGAVDQNDVERSGVDIC